MLCQLRIAVVCSVTGLGSSTYTASQRGGLVSIRRVLCGICGN